MLNQLRTKRMRITPRISVSILACLFIAAATGKVYALTLADAIEQGLHNDPTYLAAQANANANRARSSQAFARLMPQLTASANTNSNRRAYALMNSKVASAPESYNSHGTQLNLTQPILHIEKFWALDQADLLVSQAEYQLLAAEKDLLIRLVQAWLDIVQARDAVNASDSKLRTGQKELDLAQRASEQGLMSITELESAHAKRDQAESEQVNALTEYDLKLAALEQIVGQSDLPENIELSDRLLTLKPQQSTPEQWIARAEEGSPAILAARHALDAALKEVHKQRAGHMATLDLVASYNNSTQGSGLTGGQVGFSNTVNSVGLQLNVPLFSGGEQSAKVGEALAMRDKASYELEATRRSTHLKIKQAWLNWKSSLARHQFGQQAVKSAVIALKSAQTQRMHGLKADLDVLQALQQRDEVLRDMNKARNDVILNYFKLGAETGLLSAVDILRLELRGNAVTLDEWTGFSIGKEFIQ